MPAKSIQLAEEFRRPLWVATQPVEAPLEAPGTGQVAGHLLVEQAVQIRRSVAETDQVPSQLPQETQPGGCKLALEALLLALDRTLL
jgi:hypothetical protein